MKAMAAPGYGPLALLAEIDAPMPTPASGEVRVRVVASALNPADYKVVLGTLKFVHGRKKPLVVGYDFSGVIDAVGSSAGDFAVGDEVFGFLPYSPFSNRGAFAEALIARTDEIAKKPKGVSHEIAAASATTGITAIQSLRDLGRLPASDGRVLITGASGGVGSIAIGIAVKMHAHVTALGSGKGLALATRLGANETLDRTKLSLPGDLRERFDVIFDPSAAYRWRTWRGALKSGGTFVTTLPSLAFAVDSFSSMFSSTRVRFINVKSRASDLRQLATWLDEGLEVPLASTISVRDVAQGLETLHKSGGRVSVRVANAFTQ